MQKGWEETEGLVACPQKKFLSSRPLERRKTDFYNVEYTVFSSLIYMLGKKTDPQACFHRILMTKYSVGKSYAIRKSNLMLVRWIVQCPLLLAVSYYQRIVYHIWQDSNYWGRRPLPRLPSRTPTTGLRPGLFLQSVATVPCSILRKMKDSRNCEWAA